MKKLCRNCKRDISRKHSNAIFCSNKGNGNCKDQYHNRVNPRGYDDGYDRDMDAIEAGWDGHKNTF